MGDFSGLESGAWVRATAHVTGVVQGVGFRYWTARKAEELGLRGTVRNKADGSLAIVVEGPQGLVLAFREWLRSPAAPGRVEAVEESVAPATGEYINFQVIS